MFLNADEAFKQAEHQSRSIVKYWQDLGFKGIQVTFRKKSIVDGLEEPLISYELISNIGPSGYPPKKLNHGNHRAA